MMDFQITIPERLGQRFIDILERGLCILEYNWPTPSSDVVRQGMTVGEDYVSKPGKVGRVDTGYLDKRNAITTRYLDAYGRVPNEDEIRDEMEEMEWT